MVQMIKLMESLGFHTIKSKWLFHVHSHNLCYLTTFALYKHGTDTSKHVISIWTEAFKIKVLNKAMYSTPTALSYIAIYIPYKMKINIGEE